MLYYTVVSHAIIANVWCATSHFNKVRQTHPQNTPSSPDKRTPLTHSLIPWHSWFPLLIPAILSRCLSNTAVFIHSSLPTHHLNNISLLFVLSENLHRGHSVILSLTKLGGCGSKWGGLFFSTLSRDKYSPVCCHKNHLANAYTCTPSV